MAGRGIANLCRAALAPLRQQHLIRAQSSLADAFYADFQSQGHAPTGTTIVGHVLDRAVDLKRARPGDLIRVPYEVTVGDGMREFWQAAFYSHDRVNTSAHYARALGLQDQVLPFSLMLFLAGSMSHADAAVVQVAYHHGQYLFPGFAGDTFTKTFRINGLRSIKATSGQMTAYGIICEVINQHGRVCFVAEKTLLFPWKIPPSEATAEPQPPRQQTLKEHFINQSEKLLALGGTSLSRLRAGQLIIHSHCRPLTLTQSMALSSLGRLNHDRHYNTVKYSGDELMIPGGLVYALSTAATARDLHEILHEELVNCNFINPLRPGDVMGCISYISAAETHVNGVLERLTVKTIGIKGMDVRDLKGQPLPLALFTTPKLRTKRVEEICAKECPELSKRIVVISERTIMRQAPKTDMFLL